MMPGSLEVLLTRLRPMLGEADGPPETLGGGITNHNFKVRLGGSDYVVRVTSPDSVHLLIDRQAEHAASLVAAGLGVGPEVSAFLPDAACLVTRFIPGRSIPPEELRSPKILPEVAAAVRAFHDGPVIPATFSAFRVVEAYHRTASARGAVIPPAYQHARRIAGDIEAALTGVEHRPVPCHNDLLNANMIHDGSRVRIVDWEYAGMGDRYFDFGNLSINNGFEEPDDERLLVAYFGQPCSARRFACLRLMRIMSDFREAMWGVVQTVISKIEFDYPGYATKHFERLAACAADSRYPAWLEAARAS